MFNFDIVIPTHLRNHLLDRTLLSIYQSVIPPSLGYIIVVENGAKSGAEFICDSYKSDLPIQYIYEEDAGLSNARNAGSALSRSDIILFIDDDIRLSSYTLTAYHDAFQKHGLFVFYGGPLYADYETTPEEWLTSFLPWSATGFSFGDHELVVTTPSFLGGNLAVPRLLLNDIGLFDGVSATGRDGGGLGEETRLQEALLDKGIKGIYVPGALVGHFVPANRCNKKFIKKRQYRHGYTEGYVENSNQSNHEKKACMSTPCWYWSSLFKNIAFFILSHIYFSRKTTRFQYLLNIHYYIGRIDGFRGKAFELNKADDSKST